MDDKKDDAASQALMRYMDEMDGFLCKVIGEVCGFEMDFGGKLRAAGHLSVIWPDRVRVQAAMAGMISGSSAAEAASIMISAYSEIYRMENGGFFKPKNTKVMMSIHRSAEKAVNSYLDSSKRKGLFMDFHAPFINLYNGAPSGAKAWQNLASRIRNNQ